MKVLNKILLIISMVLLIGFNIQVAMAQVEVKKLVEDPEPLLPYIEGDFNICIDVAHTFFIANLNQAPQLIEWSVFGGEIISGQGSSEVTVKFTSADCGLSVSVLLMDETGFDLTKEITPNAIPTQAGIITGSSNVSANSNNIIYSVPTIYPNVTDYVWTLPSGASIVSGYNTNTITVNFSASAVSGNISVFGRNSCGDGLPSSKSITIGGVLPSPAGTISGNVSVCPSANGVVYTVPPITGATGYVWTLPTGASGVSTTNSISVNFSSTATSGNISVYGTNSFGNGNSSSKYIAIGLPLPAGTISGSTSSCAGFNNIYYSVPPVTGATGYVWTLPVGASIASGSNTNSIYVNFSSSAVSGNISVYGTNGCGNGNSSSKLVTISNSLPSPAGEISGNSPVVSGSNGVSYSVPTISGATSYNWTLPSGVSIVSGVNTNSITVNYSYYATSGNISVVGVNSCGSGTVSSKHVTVNAVPLPAGPISGQTEVLCPGVNGVKYSVTPISGATGYNWILPTGASIISGNNTNIIYVNYTESGVSGIIRVCGTNSYGNGQFSPLIVSVNGILPKPAGVILGNTSVCAGANGITYSVTSIAGATGYIWTLPIGASIASGNNTNSISVNFSTSATSGNISVYGTNICGNGSQYSLPITVGVPANAGAISGSNSVLRGTNNIVYTISAIPNATSYVWSLPSGATGTSNTNSISVSYSSTAVSGNISVYGVNSCGNGNPSTLAIDVQGEMLTNKQVYQGLFVVNGDKNTYYPVVFKYGNQDRINHLRIFRSYSEAGPTTIDATSLTHRGGLTLEVDANYGGWGGSTYDWRIMDLRQTYHETFAGATHAMHNMGFIVWLRGGGFLYHYETDYAANLQIAYSSSEKIYDNAEPSYIVYAPNPKVSPDITSNDLHRTGYWKSENGKINFTTGKIGIGTSSPNYLLSVKGVIGTNDLIIEDLTTWPDFVFKPSYSLQSLHDLEQFIKANHHLPEIPSEDDVKKDGIDLGDMNAKLLQKIEELTLYVIEHNSKINNQKREIDTQNSQIIELEKNQKRINNLEKRLQRIKRR